MSNCNLQRRRFGTLLALGIGASITLCGAIEQSARAQPAPVEVVYATFLDPNNQNDPRAAAQTKVLAEFERLNPNIKVRVVVDPPGSNGARALRTRADSPDVIRATNFQMPEYVATGSLMQLDELVARDKIDPNDWLVPLSKTMVRGHIYGMQQDYRIPILIYRKHLLDEAKVEPPRTWGDVCISGAKLGKANVAGFAIPIGVTGGIGGAQAFGEFHLSTMIATPNVTHARIATDCLERGVPVIIEKPIAHTVDDAQRICDVSRSKDVPALVGHHRRYNPIVRHAKQIIDSGKLGRPVAATVLCTWRKPDEYFNVACDRARPLRRIAPASH